MGADGSLDAICRHAPQNKMYCVPEEREGKECRVIVYRKGPGEGRFLKECRGSVASVCDAPIVSASGGKTASAQLLSPGFNSMEPPVIFTGTGFVFIGASLCCGCVL